METENKSLSDKIEEIIKQTPILIHSKDEDVSAEIDTMYAVKKIEALFKSEIERNKSFSSRLHLCSCGAYKFEYKS